MPWLVKVDMERNTSCKLLTREKVSGRHMGREKNITATLAKIVFFSILLVKHFAFPVNL